MRSVRGKRRYLRRSYGRRSLPKYRKTTVSRTHGSKSLAVYFNPWSTSTTNPKIPDGKSYHSSGIRLQAVKEVTQDAGATQIAMLLFPGLSNGFLATGTVKSFADGFCESAQYSNHGGLGATNQQDIATEIARWRLVSQGMKVTLTNNSDENDGWWEAIRVNVNTTEFLSNPTNAEGWQMRDDGAGSFHVGAQNLFLPSVSLDNLVEHPTYVSGKLRDIHRHNFQLMPQGQDHDFTQLPRDLANDLYSRLVDSNNYDAILVIIHGRGGTTPTRCMAHVVSNQELVYQESSAMKRYHSESDVVPNFQQSKRRMMLGPHKAAKKQRTAAITYS